MSDGRTRGSGTAAAKPKEQAGQGQGQIAAVVGALVWLLVAEQLLIALFPAIGRWTPGGAAAGMLQLGREATTHGDLLPAWAGGLVLVAYATVIGLLASAVTLRRDIT